MLENAASDTHPDAEVIMATGHGAMDLAIMSLKYEAADFITKLINIDVLEVALRKVHLIAYGGTAMTLIGVKPSTKDIDHFLELLREKGLYE